MSSDDELFQLCMLRKADLIHQPANELDELLQKATNKLDLQLNLKRRLERKLLYLKMNAMQQSPSLS